LDLPAGPIRVYTNIEAIPLTTSLALIGFWLGFSVAPILIPAHTIIQENTPDQIRGRVYSVLMIIVSTLSLLPIVISGGLADAIGISLVFALVGIFTAIVGVLLLAFPLFKRLLPDWTNI
jgi:MFS family permease